MEESPCIRLARGKFELTNQDSAGGKNSSVPTSSWNQATFVTGDGITYPRKGIYNFKNQTRWQKVKNMNHVVFLSFSFGAKNGPPGALHGNSLVVRRVSPGRIIVVLFWTKYAVPRRIKPGILKLTTSRGQRNLCTVFIFVRCVEKGSVLSYRFVRIPKFWLPIVLRAQPPYARHRSKKKLCNCKFERIFSFLNVLHTCLVLFLKPFWGRLVKLLSVSDVRWQAFFFGPLYEPLVLVRGSKILVTW